MPSLNQYNFPNYPIDAKARPQHLLRISSNVLPYSADRSNKMPSDIRSFFGGKGGQGSRPSQDQSTSKEAAVSTFPDFYTATNSG